MTGDERETSPVYGTGKCAPAILVVDDERLIGMALMASLRRLGYAPAGLAGNGEEAVRLCGEKRPDLVLMDVRLQGEMDGVEAAERINRLYGTPIIFLTAFWDEKTVARAKRSGPYAFLVKPYEDRDLQTAIELALYKAGMEKELLRAMRAAEAANEAKTSFLATISHELRTPLNGILGMTDLMQLSDLPEDQRENLDLIKDSALSLLSVINQILDYSRIEARILELREGDFELPAVLDAVAGSQRILASRKGLTLEVAAAPEVPAALRGDHGRLSQVLGHLLHNGVKYTPAGKVTLRVSLADQSAIEGAPQPEKQVRLHFTVTDTGIGIPPERFGDIFESFTQLEGYMTRSQGGLGLGLATCRKLVALMGGRLWAESTPGSGSSFHFVVPFTRRQAVVRLEPRPPRPAAPASATPLNGLRILVAEDNLVNRRFVTRSLERQGCRVVAVEDGKQALDALAKEPCDLVLMDVQMPVLDGIETTRRIRAGYPGVDPGLPIVALTAHAMAGDEQWCLDAGMNAYVPKPVEMEDLLAVIRKVLAGATPGKSSGDSA